LWGRDAEALALADRIKGQPLVLSKQLTTTVEDRARVFHLGQVADQEIAVTAISQKTEVLAVGPFSDRQFKAASQLADLWFRVVAKRE
jgi:hypothetical protein